ncbi:MULTISPECIES: beta-phosphoglucomutase family hydrolase [Klebsiella]|uniref:beta-phosphoglucomutase family hydrolase n=1 Tax=Klebsiella TaxID=570 RepID=UPI000471FE64|nr:MULTISPECIES: beta-phosphoglucomutase family hydrolase [Klebsiella]UDC37800.1 beta-phosphoglucomutase family hydrolase [Klebsiella quasivariicola]SLO17407.1 phosphatase YqaB [Klebsiella quasivariicola]VAN57228.1 phosphatase YqaB [Klebsiella quasivariicola]VGP09402.1 Fructose-1-phosphate phosphatase YqaB [Klebsiella quasivariicola]
MPVSFKALIFDMDGTLFDTEPLHRNAWREAFAPFNMTFEDEDFIPYNGSSPVNVACALIASRKLNADPVAIATRKKSAVERMLRDDPVAFLPAATLLERYHADFRIGLGTGSGASTASTLLGRFSFLKHFQAIVSADDVLHPKPHPDTFTQCAAILGVAPAECLVFEDSDFGLVAAQRAGMSVVDVKAKTFDELRQYLLPDG